MIDWTNRPPAPTEFAGIRLYRVPPGKTAHGIVTSDHLVGCYTHFWKRKTTPCTGPDCPACLDAVPARWHGYLSVCSIPNRIQSVMELTQLAAAPVASYEDAKGSLRGAEITAMRIGNRPNSPVQITINATNEDLRTLPRQVNIERFLATLWGLRDEPPETPEKSAPRPNIRNTLPADPPGRPPQPLHFSHDPARIEAAKSNGDKP